MSIVINVAGFYTFTDLQHEYSKIEKDYDNIKQEHVALQKKYNATKKQYNSLQSDYVLLQANYNHLQEQYNLLQQQYQTLQNNHTALETEYNSLQEDYNLLYNNFKSLQSDYGSLDLKYMSLQDDYEELQLQYHLLEKKYQTLQNNYSILQSQYNSIQNDYSNLNNKYNSLKAEYDAIEGEYNSIMETISKREAILPQYAQQFITPNDPEVKNKAKSILGSNYNGVLTWDDMNKIFNWIHSNVKYNYDTYVMGSKGNGWGECWLYPSETLSKKRGDCEDQALLFISLCLAEEKVGWIFCAALDVGGDGHMVVFINVEGDKMNIYDPTNGYKSPYSMSESSAISSYKLAVGYTSVRVKAIFNQQIYKTFSSNQEFYNWF